jgi:hypothetical protein
VESVWKAWFHLHGSVANGSAQHGRHGREAVVLEVQIGQQRQVGKLTPIIATSNELRKLQKDDKPV